MLIDWFTVGAQALNFLILVGLMRRFLYKPILHAIDVREKGIAAKLADAASKEVDAKKEQDTFRQKNEELDGQRAELLAKATNAANVERKRLLGEARTAADDLSSKRKDGLRREADGLDQSIRALARDQVFAIARKALTELASTSLEERMGEVFTRRLREMNAPARATLGKALAAASPPAVVHSAFELPSEQRTAIQRALDEVCSAEVHVSFATVPDLVSGIELATSGQKVAWTIADYLTSMEKHVTQLMPEAKSQ